MESKLTKLKAFKKTALSEEERGLLRAHAANIVMTSPVLVTASFFKRGVQHGFRIALTSMLSVVFLAGFISVAAKNSLPGDPLYPVKNINEEVKAAFLSTPQQKAVDAETRVASRFNEIQTLAQTNSLTPANQEIAAKALNNNIADLSTNLNTLSAQAPNTALTVAASLEQTLKANKNAIENTPATTPETDSGKADALQTVDNTLQQVSNQEVQIISTEINTINTAVTNVPDTVTSTAESMQTPSTTPVTITPATP